MPETADIFVFEKKVETSMTPEIENIFATMVGEMGTIEARFTTMSGPIRRHNENEAKDKIEAIERMAINLVVSAIRRQTEGVQARLTKLVKAAEFEWSNSIIIDTHYTKDIQGCVWLRRVKGGLDVELTISRRVGESRGFIGEPLLFAEKLDSFETAYQLVFSRQTEIHHHLTNMIANAAQAEQEAM